MTSKFIVIDWEGRLYKTSYEGRSTIEKVLPYGVFNVTSGKKFRLRTEYLIIHFDNLVILE